MSYALLNVAQSIKISSDTTPPACDKHLWICMTLIVQKHRSEKKTIGRFFFLQRAAGMILPREFCLGGGGTAKVTK